MWYGTMEMETTRNGIKEGRILSFDVRSNVSVCTVIQNVYKSKSKRETKPVSNVDM
jgi:hypothetical protein